jgi:DNA-directed RNA polymerase subunit RPC12/RpoP
VGDNIYQICLRCGWQHKLEAGDFAVAHCSQCGEEMGVTMTSFQPEVGWKCPVCGKGVSPKVDTCHCTG